MGGILKNPLTPQEVGQKQESESVSEFRKQVFKNTQLNAKLTAGNGIDSLNAPFAGDKIVPGGGNGEGVFSVNSVHPDDNTGTPVSGRRRSSSSSSGHGFAPRDALQMKLDEEERLQWNKRNLEENEITKQQFQDIHVDEPKTPYQGAVDPEGEYYRDDDDDDDENNNEGPSGIPPLPNDAELDDFTLGEPEYAIVDNKDEIEGSQGPDVHMAETPDLDDGEDEEEDLDEEATRALKHKKFEEMRKKHYNLREMFKNRRNHPEDEDEDEDDNGN